MQFGTIVVFEIRAIEHILAPLIELHHGGP
jgi:hypothetical protein